MPNPAAPTTMTTTTTTTAVITRDLARRHLLNKTKPPGSLGALEHWAEKLMLVQQSLRPTVSRTLLILFAADNGLASVSAYPRSVTREMLRNVAEGGAAINCLCRAHGIDLRVMDLGVDLPSASTRYEAVDHFRLTNAGTADPRVGEAMDETVFSFVMGNGRKALQAAVGDGVQVVGLGELGIGNTAVASLLLAAATGEAAERTTGAGTGVVGERFVEKCQAVQAAVDMWKERGVVPAHGYLSTSNSDSNSVDKVVNWSQVLRTLGDLEITAMSTLIHEAAITGPTSSHILVVVDGFITQVALLYAMLMYPDAIPAIVQHTLLAHVSAEKPQALLLETLRNVALRCGHVPEDQVKEWTTPVGDWGMRLGEGSGAALVIPLLKSAAVIATEMATFEAAGVSTEKQD